LLELNKRRQKEGLAVFMNPRNLSAGTIRQLDPRLVAERPLRFHAYDLLRTESSDVKSNEIAYKYLEELGFYVDKEAHKEKYSIGYKLCS
jgi:DNA ligase (NAD+)